MRSPTASWDVLQRQTWIQLQELPNIGPAMAGDLVRLGVRSVDDLSRRDPHVLYDTLARLDGVRHDPCVLDTFAAAIHTARTGESVPWWEFSRKRKATQAGSKPQPPARRARTHSLEGAKNAVVSADGDRTLADGTRS